MAWLMGHRRAGRKSMWKPTDSDWICAKKKEKKIQPVSRGGRRREFWEEENVCLHTRQDHRAGVQCQAGLLQLHPPTKPVNHPLLLLLCKAPASPTYAHSSPHTWPEAFCSHSIQLPPHPTTFQDASSAPNPCKSIITISPQLKNTSNPSSSFKSTS